MTLGGYIYLRVVLESRASNMRLEQFDRTVIPNPSPDSVSVCNLSPLNKIGGFLSRTSIDVDKVLMRPFPLLGE